MINKYINSIKLKINDKRPIVEYLSTGFPELDSKILGLQKGELITIASEPNGGKTSFALATVLTAIENKKSVIYLLMGENPEKFIAKLICQKFVLSISNFLKGDYSNVDKKTMDNFLQLVSKYLIIKDSIFLDVYDVENSLYHNFGKEIDLIVIDSLSYITNEIDTPINIVKKIKETAYSFQIPILLLVNLNVEKDSLYDTRPKNTDIPDYQNIFEYSEKVLAIYSDEKYQERIESIKEIEGKHRLINSGYKSTFIIKPLIEIEIHVMKNASGTRSLIRLDFQKGVGKIVNKPKIVYSKSDIIDIPDIS